MSGRAKLRMTHKMLTMAQNIFTRKGSTMLLLEGLKRYSVFVIIVTQPRLHKLASYVTLIASWLQLSRMRYKKSKL